MTKEELEKIIETDLFQLKGFATRYIDYGKVMVSADIFSELEALDEETRVLQRQVEDGEKAQFEALKAAHPEQTELLQAFADLLKTVDQGHTNIMNTFKKSRYEAIKAKYGV